MSGDDRHHYSTESELTLYFIWDSGRRGHAITTIQYHIIALSTCVDETRVDRTDSAGNDLAEWASKISAHISGNLQLSPTVQSQ